MNMGWCPDDEQIYSEKRCCRHVVHVCNTDRHDVFDTLSDGPSDAVGIAVHRFVDNKGAHLLASGRFLHFFPRLNC